MRKVLNGKAPRELAAELVAGTTLFEVAAPQEKLERSDVKGSE